MKAWAIALVALIVGAGAVIASLLAVQSDRTSDGNRVSSPVAGEPSFTVIDDQPKASPSPIPSGEPSLSPIGITDDPAPTATPRRRSRRSIVRVQSGEIEESSTDQELEEEEAEREAEEEEERAKAREERRSRDD